MKATIESGQFFRYTKQGDAYILQSAERVFSCTSYDDFPAFFQMDVSPQFNTDALLDELRSQLHVRIIKQDPWECLVSFVCSSASNIPRIKGMVEAISREYGKEIIFQDKLYYTFPNSETIMEEATLRRLGLGYRGKYVALLSQQVDKKYFQQLEELSYEEARKKLMQLPGVGPKVADCVCLYGLQHHEAFPIDTWIRKVLEEHYVQKGSYEDLRQFAKKRFGSFAGWAQQYLFHWKRNLFKPPKATSSV